ncbi:thermonuclease family protein [Bacillus subtilis]|uniref:thermonuclease family protein n=1 Tax=Bacillus subtilis TaxID=1423 RepID=UPI002DB6B560|nr:thermonuclease family protein [Bacillus subtilis]MEC2198089.1 thermonuclease family protein [Bacillus subtilis]MEC2331814.1 thermonuclease family protein [Bacillus subtilis]
MINNLLRRIVISILTMTFLLVGVLSAHAQTYTSTVKKVVDGDTIHLNQPVLGSTKMRLLSIDTPETNFQGKNQGEHAFAATNYLTQLLPSGTKVTIELGEECKDQYGRLLGHVYKSSLDVNKEMVRKGHAVTYFIYPNINHFTEYQSALVQAKNKGLGIWSRNNPLEELPFVFRARVSQRGLTKWVVDSQTKQIYAPHEYTKVPVERRLFFMSKSEATDFIRETINK